MQLDALIDKKTGPNYIPVKREDAEDTGKGLSDMTFSYFGLLSLSPESARSYLAEIEQVAGEERQK